MEKLVSLLLDRPGLAFEITVPCALWGLIEREDDENLMASSLPAPKLAQDSPRSAA